MESINGRMQTLQNHMQELAQTTIDTDWIKETISFFDTLIQGLNTVVGGFDSINIAAGLLLGTVQTISGIKLFDFSGGKPQAGSLLTLLQGMGKHGVIESANIANFGNLLEESNISAKDLLKKAFPDQEMTAILNQFSGKARDSLNSVWATIEDGSAKATEVFQKNANGALVIVDQQVKSAKTKLTDFVDSVKSMGSMVSSILVNAIVSAGVSFIVSSVVKAVAGAADEILHHQDKVIERGKEAQKQIEDIYKTVEERSKDIKDLSVGLEIEDASTNSTFKNLDEIAKKYVELKKGVDSYNNSNKNLTTDKYQEYLDISNELGEQFPTLIKGYDSQGNAILKLNSNLSECTDLLKSVYKSALDVSNVDIGKNIKNTIDGLLESIVKINDELDTLNLDDLRENFINLANEREAFNKNTEITPENMDEFFKIEGNQITLSGNPYSDGRDIALRDALLSSSGINVIGEDQQHSDENGEIISVTYTVDQKFADMIKNASSYGDNPYSNDANLYRDNDVYDGELGEQLKNFFDSYFNSDYIEINQSYEKMKQEVNTSEMEDSAKRALVQDKYAQATDITKKYLQTSSTFNDVGEELQNAILMNFRFDEKIADEYVDDYKSDFSSFVYSEILGVLEDMSNVPESDVNKLTSVLTGAIFDKDQTIGELEKEIREIYETVFGDNALQMLEYTGISDLFYGENDIKDKRQFVRESLKSNANISDEQAQEITGMSYRDIEKAYDLLSNTVYTSYTKFKQDMENTVQSNRTGDFTKDLLGSDVYKESAKEIEESLSAIQSAIDAYNSGEDVDFEALQSHGIGIDSYSDILSLQKEGGEQIQKWVDLLFKQADAVELSNSGMKELYAYIGGIYQKYKDIDISQTDVTSALRGKILGSSTSVIDEANASKQSDQVINELLEKYDDIDLPILYATVEALPEGAYVTVDQLYQYYEDMAMKIPVSADVTEFQNRMSLIEDTIKQAQQNVSTAQAQREYDNARGIYSNDALYIQRQIVGKGIEKSNIDRQIEDYRTGKNTNSVAYRKENGGFKSNKELEAAIRDEELAIAELEAQKIQIDIEIVGLEDDKTLLPLTKMENELTLVKQKSEDLSRTLEKKGEYATIDDYTSAIENASEQIEILQKEERFWQQLLQDPFLDKSGAKYVEYKSKLADVETAIDNLTESQKDWNKAINDLPIEEANKKIEDYAERLGILQGETAVEEAKGNKKSKATYIEENSLYLNTAKEESRKIETAQNNIDQIQKPITDAASKITEGAFNLDSSKIVSAVGDKATNSLQGSIQLAVDNVFDNTDFQIDPNANFEKDVEDYENTITDSTNKMNEANRNYYENLHAWDEQQLSDAQTNLERNQTRDSQIQNNITEQYTDKNFVVPESVLENQRNSIDDTIKSATELQTLLQSLMAKNVNENGDLNEFGIQYEKQLEGVEQTLNELNEKQIAIDTELSQRNIERLQVKIDEVASNISTLNRGLPNSTDQAETLNSLISESYKEIALYNEQADEYEKKMADLEISASNAGEELDKSNGSEWKNASDGVDNANAKVQELIASILEYKEQLLSLPENKIAMGIETNNAQQNINRSKLQIKQKSGNGIVTSADYNDIINNDNTNIGLMQSALTNARDKYNTIDAEVESMTKPTASKLKEQHDALIEVYEAEQNLYGAMQQLADDQEAANEAILNEYNERIKVLDKQYEDIRNQHAVDEALGKRRSKADIQADINFSQESLDETREQLKNLKLEDFIGIGDTEEEIKASQQKQFDEMESYLKEQENKYQVDAINYYNELEQFPVTEMQYELDDFTESVTHTKSEIQKLRDAGLKVPQSLLNQLYDDSERQLELVGNLRDMYDQLIDIAKKAGKDELVDQLESAKFSLDSVEAEAMENQRTAEKDPFQQRLKDRQADLNKYRDEYEKINEQIQDSSVKTTKSMYRKLSSNVGNQISIVEDEIEDYETQMADMRKAGGLSFDENNDEYQSLLQSMREAEKQLRSLKKEQEAYNDSINMMDVEKLQHAYDQSNRKLTNAQNDIKMNEALGVSVTESDVNKENEQLEALRKNAKKRAKKIRNEIDRRSFNDKDFYESDDYYNLQKQMWSAEDEAYNAELSKVQNETAKELIPINDLKEDLTELETISSGIEREYDNIRKTGGKVTAEQITQQKDIVQNRINILTDIQKEQNALAKKHKDDDFGIQYAADAEQTAAQIDALQKQIKEIELSPYYDDMRRINDTLEVTKSLGDQINRTLSDSSIVKTPQMYEEAIDNAKAQQKSLNQQILLTENAMQGLDFHDEKYQELNGTLINLQNQYDGLSDSIKDFGKSMKDLPIDNMVKDFNTSMDKINNAKGFDESLVDLFGTTLTGKQHDQIATAMGAAANRADQIAKMYQERMKEYEPGSEDYLGYEEQYIQWSQQADQYRFIDQNKSRMDSAKAPIVELQNQMQDLLNNANAVQNELNHLNETGRTGTESQYEYIVQNGNEQLGYIEAQKQAWLEYREYILDLFKANNVSLEGNTVLQEIDQSLQELDQSAQNVRSSILDANIMLNGGIEVKNLQDSLKTVEQNFEKLNDVISIDGSQGFTSYVDSYEDLTDNLLLQIDYLGQINEQLEREQGTAGLTPARFKEIDESIQDNRKSMISLNQTLDEYNKKIRNYAENMASSLNNTVSSALSESLSDTGLSSDTMDTLLGQFRQISEIADLDLSGMFTKTAQGVKLNTEEMKKLVAIQKQAFSQSVVQSIAKENEEIKKQSKAVNTNSNTIKNADKAMIEGHKKKIDALQEELVQYNAIIDSLEKQIDAFSQWQEAEQTQNEGMRYDTILNSMIEMENRSNNGQTDTDEFKKFVEMMSPNGENSSEEFDRIYETIARYFDYGDVGLDNFLADFKDAGFNLNEVVDTEELTNVFGLSEVAIQTIIDKLKERGTEILTIKDDIDASAQIIEKTDQLVDIIEKKNEAYANNQFDLAQDYEQQIVELKQQIQALSEAKDDYINNALVTSSQEYETAKDGIMELKKEYEQAVDPEQQSRIYSSLVEKANNLYANLSQDDNGNLNIDFLNFDEYTKKANEYSQALTNIYPDLTKIENYTTYFSTFESGFDRLKTIASEANDKFNNFNWNLPNEINEIDPEKRLEAIEIYLNKLKTIKINPEMEGSAEAQQSLDNFIKIATNERDLQAILKFRIDNGQSGELSDLASLTDDEVRDVLINFGIKDDEKIQEMTDFIHGKADEIPLKVELSEESINQMQTMLDKVFSDIQIQGFLSGDTVENISNGVAEISHQIDPIKLTADVNEVESMLDSYQSGVFGNIDMNNREVLEWTEENIAKYQDIYNKITENGKNKIDSSTLLGENDVFSAVSNTGEQHKFAVEFSPMLQTGTGEPVLLDEQTVSNYIKDLLTNSFNDQGQFDINKFFELDATGIQQESGIIIKNLVAGIKQNPDLENNTMDVIGQIMNLYETSDHQTAINNILSLIDQSIQGFGLSYIDVEADPAKLITSLKSILNNVVMEVGVKATPSTASNAYGTLGSGFVEGTDGALSSNTTALVNEVGTEGLIRDGQLTEIPGGMHIQKFQKGDVIINHKQMEELNKHKKASGKGKIVGGESAFAHGTMPAFANPKTIYASRQNPLSRETFNLFDTKIQDLNKQLSRLADVIDEYSSSEDKYANSLERQNIILEEISLYQQESETLREKANKIATNYEYTTKDANGNTTVSSMDLKYYAEGLGYNLEDFLTGKAKISDIKARNDWEVNFVNGLKEYIDLMQQADSATDSVYDLNGQLRDVSSVILQIPFDKLNKQLHQLGNEASRINSLINVASNGDAAIANMDKMLHELFGDKADSMFNSSGTSLDVSNRLTDDNIENLRQTVYANKTAYDEALQTLENFKNDKENTKNKLTEKQKQVLQLDGLKESTLNKISNGDLISNSDLKQYDESTQKVLLEYNALADDLMNLTSTVQEASEKVDDQLVQVQESIGNYSVAEANKVQEYIDHANKYYGARSDYYDALAGKSKAQANYLERGKYSRNAGAIRKNLEDSINFTNESISQTEQKLAKYQEYAQNIEEGSDDWFKYQTLIANTETELINLKGTLSDTYAAMGDIPAKVVQEKLQDIENKYHGITTALSSGLTESSASVNAYNRLASRLGAPNALGGLSGSGYQMTNQLLDREVEIAQEEAEVAVQGYRDAMANLNDMIAKLATGAATQEDVDAATKQLEEAKNLMDDKLMQAAVKEVKNFEQSVKNIDNHYQNIVSHIDTMINKLKINQQYLEVGNGYSVNGANIEANLQEQLGQVQQQQAVLAQDVAEMEARLAQGIANGTIQVGDETWLALDTSINQVRNSMQNLQLTQLQLYEDMANVPNKVVEAKLKEIEDAYNGITTAMNKNLTMSMGAINNYRRVAQSIGQDIFGGTEFAEEYRYQDLLLTRDLERLKQEADVAVQGFLEAEARYYAGGTEEQIRLAKQAMETARGVMNEKLMELSTKQVQNYLDGMKNVEQYYSNINGYIDAQIQGLKLQNELLQGYDNTILDQDTYNANTDQIAEKIKDQIINLTNAIYEIEFRVGDALNDGTMSVGDQAWTQAATQVENLKNQLLQLKINQKDLFKDVLDSPAKETAKLIDELAYKYRLLNSAMNENIVASESTRKQWNMLNDWGRTRGLQIDMKYYDDSKSTIELQLEQLDEEVQKEQETLQIYADELMKSQINADKTWDNEAMQIEAQQKLKEAEIQYMNQQAKLAALRVDQIGKKMDAIQNYYETMNGSLEADIKLIRAERDVDSDYGFDTEGHQHYNNTERQDSFKKEFNIYSEEIENVSDSIYEMEAQLNNGLFNGTIVEGDEVYAELSQKIKNATSELKNLQKTQMDVFKDMAHMPLDTYQKYLDEAETKYSRISGILSNGIDSDVAMLRTLTRLADIRRDIGSGHKGLYSYEGIPINPNDVEYEQQAQYILTEINKSDENLQNAYKAALDAYEQYDSFIGPQSQKDVLQKASEEAMQAYFDAETENIKTHYDGVQKLLNNMRSYYSSLNGLISATSQLAEQQRNNIVNYLGYSGNQKAITSSFGKTILGILEQQDNDVKSARFQREQVKAAISNKEMDVEGASYRQAMTEIYNTESEIEQLKAQYLDLIKEMLSVPSKIIEEKINDITNAYSGLSAAISSGILATSGSTRVFTTMIDDLQKSRNGSNFAESSTNFILNGSKFDLPNNPSYVRQNQAIVNDFERQKEETKLRIQEAMANEDIYNAVIKKGSESTQEEIKIAKQNMQEAIKTAQESMANLAKSQMEMLSTMVENISSYYERINNYISKINDNLKATTDFIIKTNGYRNNHDTIVGSYAEQIKNTRNEAQLLVNNIEDVQRQMRQALNDDNISFEDDELVEIGTRLRNLQSELIGASDKLYDLYEALYNIPNQEATEKIDDIAKAYENLSSVISSSVINTMGGQRVLNQLMNQLSTSNPYINKDQLDFEMTGKTFVGQNAALLLNYQKQKEELDALNTAMISAGKSLDTLKTKVEKKPKKTIADQISGNLDGIFENDNIEVAEIGSEEINNIIKEQEEESILKEDVQDIINNQLENVNIEEPLKKIKNEVVNGFEGIIYDANEINVPDELDFFDNLEVAAEDDLDETLDNLAGHWSELDEYLKLDPSLKVEDFFITERDRNEMLSKITDSKDLNNHYEMPMNIDPFLNLDKSINSLDIKDDILKNIPALEEELYLEPEIIINPTETKTIKSLAKNAVVLKEATSDAKDEFEALGWVAEEFDAKPVIYFTKDIENVKVTTEATKEELNAAQKAFDEASRNFTNKAMEFATATAQLVKQQVQNIDNYYNSLISHQKSLKSSYESLLNMVHEFGKAMDNQGNLITDTTKVTSLYENQINSLEKQQQLLADNIVEDEAYLDQLRQTVGEDTEEYMELESQLINLRNQYNETAIAKNKLEDEMRNEIYIKPLDEAIFKLSTIRENLMGINGLLDEEGKITEQGEYTDMGMLSLGLYVESLSAANAELDKQREKYNTIHERWINDASYSDEEYLKDSQAQVSAIQNTLQSINASKQSILTQIKNRYRTELDYIKKLISAQSEQLSKQKELADYDKSLKDKTNAVKQLEAQLRALENLNDAESRAQKVRIQEQLQNSREDLDNTVQDHVVSLRQEGLSKLSENLDKAFEKYTKELAINIDEQTRTIETTSKNIGDSIDRVNKAFTSLLDNYGTGLTIKMATGVNDITTSISDSYNTDYQHTSEMESAKAQKLEEYESNKLTALNNHEMNQKLRDDEMKRLQSAYQETNQADSDEIKSDLDTIVETSSQIDSTLSNVGEAITGALSTNSGNIISEMSSAKDIIKDSIDSYNISSNDISSSVSEILSNLKEVNTAVQYYTGKEHKEEIEKEAPYHGTETGGSDHNITTTHSLQDQERDSLPKVYNIDGKLYELGKDGTIPIFSKESLMMEEDAAPITNTSEIIKRGERYKIASIESNGKYLIESTKSRNDGFVDAGTYVSLNTLDKYGINVSGGNYKVGSIIEGKQTIERESSYKASDVVKYDNLPTGKYGFGGTTNYNGQPYGIISSVESADKNATKYVGSIIPVSELNKHNISIADGEFTVGSFDEILKKNEQLKKNPGYINGTQVLHLDKMATGSYTVGDIITMNGQKYGKITGTKGNAESALMKDKYISIAELEKKYGKDYKSFSVDNNQSSKKVSSQSGYLGGGGSSYYQTHTTGEATKTSSSSDTTSSTNKSSSTKKDLSYKKLKDGKYHIGLFTNGKYKIYQGGKYTGASMTEDELSENGLRPSVQFHIRSGRIIPVQKSNNTTKKENTKSNSSSSVTSSSTDNGFDTAISTINTQPKSQIKQTVPSPTISTSSSTVQSTKPSQSQDVAKAVGQVIKTAQTLVSGEKNTHLRQDATLMDENVLKAFEDLGFKYLIDENFKKGEGYFNAKSQQITITKDHSQDIYHELGHFIGFITGNKDSSMEFRKIYEDEKSKFQGTYRGYAKTSITEFFAECVREYFLNRNNFKSWCPQAFDYIQNTLKLVTQEQINKIAKTYKTIWANNNGTVLKFTDQYANGTLNAKKGIAQVFEQGPEIITTKKGTFVPFQGGEGVIPAKQTQTLLNLSKAFSDGSIKLQMPDMSSYQLPTRSTQVNSTSNNIYIDSLITINGNADANTVNEIKQIAQQLVSNKQFQENVTQFVSKRQAADSKMAGKRLNIK